MANSTFNGPVRSENGFKTIDVAEGTGTVTDGLVINKDGTYILTVVHTFSTQQQQVMDQLI